MIKSPKRQCNTSKNTYTCKVCGEQFQRCPSKLRAGTCSKECGYKIRKIPKNSGQFKGGQKPWNAGKKMSKEYRKKMSEARLNSKYCSGEGHPRWKGGKRTYYKNMARQKINETFIKKLCAICESKQNVEVHHIDKNWKNNNINNLVYLCHSCHLKLHHRTDKTKNICQWCYKVFYSGRTSSKYCSSKCRGRAWRAGNIGRVVEGFMPEETKKYIKKYKGKSDR